MDFEWIGDIALGFTMRPLLIVIITFAVQTIFGLRVKMLESAALPHPRMGFLAMIYYVINPTASIDTFFAIGFFCYDMLPWIKGNFMTILTAPLHIKIRDRKKTNGPSFWAKLVTTPAHKKHRKEI